MASMSLTPNPFFASNSESLGAKSPELRFNAPRAQLSTTPEALANAKTDGVSAVCITTIHFAIHLNSTLSLARNSLSP
jgi:hypothetical protein